MISSFRAKELANVRLTDLKKHPDGMLRPWLNAVLGEPMLVHTVDREPSYWIVPVELSGSVLGYIELGQQGQILGHAYFYTRPNELGTCPQVVTRISDREAENLACQFGGAYGDASYGEPVFVHDGPRNRLAWMIEVSRGRQVISRLFVTPGYVYERKPEDRPPPPGVRGGGRL